MDFIVSYHLYNKIKEKERSIMKEKYEDIELTKNTIDISVPNKACSRCGQNRYLCQCENNIKMRYMKFDPEKDIY